MKERLMRISVKDHIREALLTAALFGSIGAAFAQAPTMNSGDVQSAESPKVPAPKVPGRDGLEEPTARQAPQPADTGIFVNGTLTVPNAPGDTSTTPAKFSPGNDRLDHIPIMARGPELTDAQRKLILERVMAAGGGATVKVDAFPSAMLPATVDMHAWPADILGQVPGIRDTKYVKLPDKILVVRPENWIVVDEIGK
jgi:hypothetical protein